MKSVFLALALACSAAVAADADLLHCLAITDSPARLACYDALATAVRDAPAQPSAAKTAAADQNFGRPPAVVQPLASKVLDSRIAGSIAGWQRDSRIPLINGQVWQIVGDPAAFAPLNSPKVSITPGMFGSYFLEVEGLTFQVRVKRVQ
jgi:hypothetical protein